MFLNPVMLAGVGGAVVPLVLHFLSRSRFRTVDWGGMMFLGEQDRRVVSSAGLRQWTLLLLRMAIVGLLAMALARPVVAGWWGDTAGRRVIAVVLDCSASMGIEEAAGRTRFELARNAALDILARAGDQDVAALVLTGDGPVSTSLADPPAIMRQLTGLTSAGSGTADVAAALTAAADLCNRADATQSLPAEIHLVTDRQARSWDRVDDAFAAAWQAPGTAPRRDTRLYVHPVGADRDENVGIESLELTDAPIVRGQPVGVEIRIHNFGRQARPGLPISISIADQTVYSTTVSVEPGAVETVRATIKFPEAGPRVLSAAIVSPDMPADNHLSTSVDVRDPLKVKVVGDKPKYLPLALAPFDGGGAANFAAVTVASPADANLAFADGTQAVILANVPALPDAVVARLEQFVYNGGGLIIAPGPATDTEAYRRLLYRNGAGLMPAALRPGGVQVVGTTSLPGLSLDHPVFRFLRDSPTRTPAISVDRYFRTDVREGDARILANFGTAEPFLIEGAFGRGRVLLLTTPLEAEWSDLPLTSFYLPFVQSCVRYVTDDGARPRTIAVGESFSLPLDAEPRSIQVLRPDGATETPLLLREPGRIEARFPQTRFPGPHVLTYDADGASRQVRFVVRPPAAESDLTPLGDEPWGRVKRLLNAEEPAEQSSAMLLSSLGNLGRELWLPLIVGVVGLMLLESALARSWSRGGQ